jgi:hypothetical protein
LHKSRTDLRRDYRLKAKSVNWPTRFPFPTVYKLRWSGKSPGLGSKESKVLGLTLPIIDYSIIDSETLWTSMFLSV